MDINRSRLSSITEESNDNENNIKTSSALFMVYYQLYAIGLVGTQSMQEPREIFKNASHRVEQELGDVGFEGRWSEAEDKETNEKMKKCIEECGSASTIIKPPVYLSKEQLKALLPSKMHPQSHVEFHSPEKQEQHCQNLMSKELDETAESKYSLQDILEKLNDFDDERTEIKCEIFSEIETEEQNSKLNMSKSYKNTSINKSKTYNHASSISPSKTDLLYTKWTNLHAKMKETLELYLGRISSGSTKSLIEFYNQSDIMGSEKNIEGISEKELLNKLDIYLQSLFLDEREILLYREKDGQGHSGIIGDIQLSKKLTYS